MVRPSHMNGSASTLALMAVVIASLSLVVALAAYLRAGRLAAALTDAGTTLQVHLTPTPPSEVTPEAIPEDTSKDASKDAPSWPKALAGVSEIPEVPTTPETSTILKAPEHLETPEVPLARSPLLGPGETLDKLIAPQRLDTPAPAPLPGEVLPWQKAPDHFGQTITIEGTVVGTKRFRSLTLLNFAWDRQSFYIVVYPSAYDAAPDGKPEQYFLNKTLHITGQVGHYKGRPQIKVRQKGQIAVVQ